MARNNMKLLICVLCKLCRLVGRRSASLVRILTWWSLVRILSLSDSKVRDSLTLVSLGTTGLCWPRMDFAG